MCDFDSELVLRLGPATRIPGAASKRLRQETPDALPLIYKQADRVVHYREIPGIPIVSLV